MVPERPDVALGDGPIIELAGLRKAYHRRGDGGDVVAVENLDLVLGQPGTVHGFLGPNGSGKTTTIRCLLGLIRPTGGSARVFGADSTKDFHRVASRVGAIVESPKMFPNFTARRNLALLARIEGLPKREVDRSLEVVGLADRDRDSFASYSLGMKQRLAIAGALLKNPDLLILDEPANGLDPAGIAEIRRLIRAIAEDGKAVLVSSHQLAEMEQVCDEVTIINHGRLVKTGPLEHIRSFAGADQVVANIADRDGAIAVLADVGISARPRPSPDELVVDVDVDRSSEVNRVLAERGLYLSGLRSERATLEAAFLNLTGDAPPPPMAADGPPPTSETPPPTSETPPLMAASPPPPSSPTAEVEK
ncbi:MAG: ABC transporter ATP-binding protein [Acidimicrobiales bacterium]